MKNSLMITHKFSCTKSVQYSSMHFKLIQKHQMEHPNLDSRLKKLYFHQNQFGSSSCFFLFGSDNISWRLSLIYGYFAIVFAFYMSIKSRVVLIILSTRTSKLTWIVVVTFTFYNWAYFWVFFVAHKNEKSKNINKMGLLFWILSNFEHLKKLWEFICKFDHSNKLIDRK